jgi:DNA-binding NarL/FixJ family response regulator
VLAAQPDMEIVGEAQNGRDAVLLANQTLPDVVLMDLAMPVLNGLEATRQIVKQVPATKVLVLTSHEDGECVTQLMQAGAAGYLLKQTAANDLPVAIRQVRRGVAFYSAPIARRIRDESQAAARGERTKAQTRLTAREAEVLQLVASGYSNREAAVQMGISIKTIEKHRQQVMNKLNIHESAGLTRYAISKGIALSAPGQKEASGKAIPLLVQQ